MAAPVLRDRLIHLSVMPGNAVLKAASGQSLLEILRAGGYELVSPCSGKGLCGKCRVLIEAGDPGQPDEAEISFLGREACARGERLACLVYPDADLTVSLLSEGLVKPGEELILEDAELSGVRGRPYSELVRLPWGPAEDGGDMIGRLCRAVEKQIASPVVPGEGILPGLGELRGKEELQVLVRKGVIVDPDAPGTRNLGLAADLGTTTVVMYLLDLARGRKLDTLSASNSQAAYGIDVISRISHCQINGNGLSELQELITGQFASMALELLRRNELAADDVRIFGISGNTTMLHLLAGVDPLGIAHVPFSPVFCSEILLSGTDDPFTDVLPGSATLLLPGISAYVGADIVSGILSTGMDRSDSVDLLVDIGTNGEIVAGNKDELVCCAAAAGSAFEGYHISCGCRAVEGAVSSVILEDGELSYTTIADKPPVGLCGSGIVDTVALLVQTGLVDETGRLMKASELGSDVPELLGSRLRGDDKNRGFYIADNISINQKDIRQVQMAKGAIAYGIETAVTKRGVTLKDVEKVFLAGGFGNYIDPRSAAVLGLLPPGLEGKTVSVKNASGSGAMMALLSAETTEARKKIKDVARYLDLSAEADFAKGFGRHMGFPAAAAKIIQRRGGRAEQN